MLSFRGKVDDKYKIYDSADKSTALVSYDELLYCVNTLFLSIRGVIYSERLGCLYCEDMCSVNGKSIEFFREEVFNLVGDKYTVLGEYSPLSVRMRHNVCGYEYDMRPSKVLEGFGCKRCRGHALSNTDGFKGVVKELVDDEYSVMSEYKNAATPILMRHNTCGTEWHTPPSNFKRGFRCPTCAKYGMPATSFSEVARRVSERSSDYKLLEFTRMHARSKFLHLTCGSEFWMKTDTFLRLNGRCPICRKSIPEHLMQIELGKHFKCEFNCIPDWLRKSSGYKMELDVYIPSLRVAVEYDGEFFHRERLKGDILKDYSCNKCGVKVIRLREHKLPAVNSDSVQICATKQIALNYYIGIAEFERLMTELLHTLGVDEEYHLDMSLLQKLLDNKSGVKDDWWY